MKFSFNPKEYRDGLAKDLIEKRKDSKEDAKQFHEEEKNTTKYVLAKDIKNVSSKILEREDAESEPHPNGNKLEKRDIDLGYEIQTFDINDKIPESLRIYFDQIRINKIKESISDYPSISDYSIEGTYLTGDRKEDIDGRSINIMKLGRDYDPNTESMMKLEEFISSKCHNDQKYNSKITLEAKKFINEITEGAFYDPKMLIHVIEGDKKNEKVESEKRFPHSNWSSELPQEKIFDTSNASIDSLWFSAGGSEWIKPTSVVMIADSQEERFIESVGKIKSYGYDGRRDPWNDKNLSRKERLAMATIQANRNKIGGVNISMAYYELSWEDISNWIVDLYHGRLYKISKKSENKNRPEVLMNLQKTENTDGKKNTPYSVDLDDINTKQLERLEEKINFKNGFPTEETDFYFPGQSDYEDTSNYLAKIEKMSMRKKQKYSTIFNCAPEQVAMSIYDLNEQTVVFGDNIIGNYEKLQKPFPGLKYIVGDLSYFRHDDISKIFPNLEYIGGDCETYDHVPKSLKRIGGICK